MWQAWLCRNSRRQNTPARIRNRRLSRSFRRVRFPQKFPKRSQGVALKGHSITAQGNALGIGESGNRPPNIHTINNISNRMEVAPSGLVWRGGRFFSQGGALGWYGSPLQGWCCWGFSLMTPKAKDLLAIPTEVGTATTAVAIPT